MPNVVIKHRKSLEAEEFKAIQGTALYEALFRNKMEIEVTGVYLITTSIFEQFDSWLQENCSSIYHLHMGERNRSIVLYIEDEKDLIHFKMAFESTEIEEPSPPPSPPPPPTNKNLTVSRPKVRSYEWNDDWNEKSIDADMIKKLMDVKQKLHDQELHKMINKEKKK